MGNFSKILRCILFSPFFLSTLAYSAPAPPPKPITLPLTKNQLIGTWYVKDAGYQEVWVFNKDGTWQSYTTLDSYIYDSVCYRGEWWIQNIGSDPAKYLRIRYAKILVTHKLGTKLHSKQELILGDTYDGLKLEFIRKINNKTK